MAHDLYLRVYKKKSELVRPDGKAEVFLEGPMNAVARQRAKRIAATLSEGYLEKQILDCKEATTAHSFSQLNDHHILLLDALIKSVTSETGRALLALTIMQLCIKSIAPDQNIRLHKGGPNPSSFSWHDGISMRSLDNNFITPLLRRYELLKLNAHGFMMTRSLAENYPYSLVYKANIRGARSEWAEIVEEVETGRMPAEPALHWLLTQLLNQADAFKALSTEVLALLEGFLGAHQFIDHTKTEKLILHHVAQSNYAARLMEIAMHSLMQAMAECGVFGDAELKPLSQMRSANKKHGNVGDVELLEQGQIIEAWDAKFGKSYLRDELEELADKIPLHPDLKSVGFVTSGEPERLDELALRLHDLGELFGVTPEILTFQTWVERQFTRSIQDGSVSKSELSSNWLRAYVESLSLKRTDLAPIDEPCYQWLDALKIILMTEQ